MCRVLEVSPSGYYAWKKRGPSERTQEDDKLVEKIEAIHHKSRGSYGSPRIHAELHAQGMAVGRNRVARLMRENGICGAMGRKFTKTTDSNHDFPIAPNLLARQFEAPEPDSTWVADISYVWTAEGWLYLAVIIDLFSRRVVGWSMDATMAQQLVLNALRMALGHRRPSSSGLIFHSDRGSQYAAKNYRAALDEAGIACSMSRRGDCWDNAVAESFFATLKKELVHRRLFVSRADAKTAIAEYIEVFYNRIRRHSTLGYLSPVDFEDRFYNDRSNDLVA